MAAMVAGRAGLDAGTLGMLGLAAVPWLDRLPRQAGQPDLIQLDPDTAPPVLAMVSGATVGAVLASRRPATRWAGCCWP